jgi:hypothetical protein
MLREVLVMMSACREDPRAWYVTPQHHRGNGRARVPGNIGVCACACAEGYVPFLGGVGCRRAPATVPRHTPAAAITRLYEGLSVSGPRGLLATPQNAGSVEEYRKACASPKATVNAAAPVTGAAAERDDRAVLVRTICSQPDLFSDGVRAFCYEGLCATERTWNRCSRAEANLGAADAPGMLAAMAQTAVIGMLAYAVVTWTRTATLT